MRQSRGYQEIAEEGRVEGQLQEARRMLIRAGLRRLGVASAQVVARLDSINTLETLESLVDRIYDVETWDDLLTA